MCTAIAYHNRERYFGRNLDLEFSYQETVTVTPRKFPLYFRKREPLKTQYAMIGVAYVREGYPLYYDAMNEAGLGMAGLNFPGYAAYVAYKENQENIAPFELIPWVLGQCADMKQAKALLQCTNLMKMDFCEELPVTPLHWMLSDGRTSLVVEPLKKGVQVRDAPVGVLTNAPPFPVQMAYLQNFLSLTSEEPVNRFSDRLELRPYSRGMGAMGLPGDLSSSSRFVRAAFVRWNAAAQETEDENISQFFHILGSVEQPRGCVRLDDGRYEMTVYSSCCALDKGVYYYTTYENRQITAVDLHRAPLDGENLISYPLIRQQQIKRQNG